MSRASRREVGTRKAKAILPGTDPRGDVDELNRFYEHGSGHVATGVRGGGDVRW